LSDELGHALAGPHSTIFERLMLILDALTMAPLPLTCARHDWLTVDYPPGSLCCTKPTTRLSAGANVTV